MGEPTTYELEGGVATITLRRPEERNALSAELVDSLAGHLDRAADDEGCRVVVLTNEGTTFSAGADLKGGGIGRVGLAGLLRAILDHDKPVVGRIAGHCMGGGVGLAAACDLSVAAADARFGFTEVRVGVAPAIISVVCLAKMRRGDALELFLSGERVSAARACEVGLVTTTVDRDGLDEAVGRVVGQLLRGAPGALAAAKGLVGTVPALGRDEAFEWTSRLSAELFSSEEAREGMAAFREKRPPAWSPEER